MRQSFRILAYLKGTSDTSGECIYRASSEAVEILKMLCDIVFASSLPAVASAQDTGRDRLQRAEGREQRCGWGSLRLGRRLSTIWELTPKPGRVSATAAARTTFMAAVSTLSTFPYLSPAAHVHAPSSTRNRPRELLIYLLSNPAEIPSR